MKSQASVVPVGLKPNIQVRLSWDEQLVFGPGTAHLLREIQQYGSIHRACGAMGLSYSKGRQMLRKIEEQMQTSIVIRIQGGNGGGSACLTEAGKYLLEHFSCYEHMVKRYAEQLFTSYFPDEEDGDKI